MSFIREKVDLKKMRINELIFFDAKKSNFKFFLFDINSFVIKR